MCDKIYFGGGILVEREIKIREWFDMWIENRSEGIENIFEENAVYIESWGPKYEGISAIRHWFEEWNTRGRVNVWDIKQFFHKENQTIVEWYFCNKMNYGKEEKFDGLSLIEWKNDKICFLKEYGCNINNYNPYEKGDKPIFKDEQINWF